MSLAGEPAQHLKNIAISGENFVHAWDTLIARYDNKRILIDAHVAALFTTRKVKPESAAELKRLLGDVKEALGALEALDCPVRQWDLLIIFMMTRKLDAESLRRWEETLGAQADPPSFNDFESFLVSRIYTLEALDRSLPRKPQLSSTSSRASNSARSHIAAVSEQKCSMCDSDHYIASCPKYLERTIDQRREIIKSKSLCFNCLGPHLLRACRNSKRCRTCRKQHHTTLHQSNSSAACSASTSQAGERTPSAFLSSASNATIAASASATARTEPSSLSAQSGVLRRTPSVLLATAMIHVRSRFGEILQVRALLDQGSEVSFISESVAQSLKLPRRAAAIPILGIGAQHSTVSNGVVSLTIISCINSAISFSVEALVLPKLTAYLPPARVEGALWSHIQGLPLADPTFPTPGKIDLILGANVYAQVLEEGLCRGKSGDPIAQKTSLGWILSGPQSEELHRTSSSAPLSQPVTGMQCCLDSELLELLQRFWIQEEIVPRSQTLMTPEESQCEEQFRATYSRDTRGRFVVRLPLKGEINDYGDSRTPAYRSLLRMEKRFDSNPALKSSYIKFLREYRECDHMQPVNYQGHSQKREFFLPHHGVVRETSSTTKLRVVFNGSQKTNQGLSLNDTLHIGPKLQTDLTRILLRWRRHQYVFVADVEKMYRQIRVHPDDWPLQKILWRESPREKVQEYVLCTVTYGLACAPYLALRCLQQLALESEASLPLASDILRQDTYVDDVLSGATDISQTQEQIRQLNKALTAGGFTLRKWIANDSRILADIPEQDRESSSKLPIKDRNLHHTLGIQWDQRSDCFVFSAPSTSSSSITKRAVLSFIARIFDPIGWLAPIVISVKIIMQELWAIRLDWDEELPEDLHLRWSRLTQQIEKVTTISIPRWFGADISSHEFEVHGFSDASQHALAAVVYLRFQTGNEEAHVTLVSAKTKVAPLKRMTIPRLELSAAVLLVRQILQLRDVLIQRRVATYLWTDSTVALTWIRSHPSRWKDFVRNRVSFIQELSNSRWRHVPGKENPADLASRGVAPQLLQQHQLWWNGPQWLRSPSTSWPTTTPVSESQDNLDECSITCSTATESTSSDLWDLIERYSSLTSLLRTTAWLLRSRDRFQRSAAAHLQPAFLTPKELEAALLLWVRLTQQSYFLTEIRLLQSNKQLKPTSSLLRLVPILDNGILRLRGRLHHSHLDFSVKHPMILPRDSRLTTLIVDYHHRRTLHGGPQLTLASIRQKFWIIGGRIPIRSFVHRCVTCRRHRAATGQQLIGQLPAVRVTPCRPFYNTGVDYAGPLTLKTFRGRGAKTYKGYFIIFICFSTSAVHLEAATDYTTDGFIAAYKRFTGRRGLCSTITSDCGTNLIGADSELSRLFKASSKEWAHIATMLANDGVTWKFHPPAAPHFGGKWEAGVKSVKFHLRRIIGESLLTYEELATLLTQIEAILNSRPLSPLSDDATDLSALTPGHFLVGSALSTVPEPSLYDLPQNKLSRLQLLRHMTESFWKRWSSEYLHQMQTATKWHSSQNSFQKGTLVLIKDERFPPSKWPLARIIETHPGADGLVRVVTLKTATTTLKRPIAKLCVLPVQS